MPDSSTSWIKLRGNVIAPPGHQEIVLDALATNVFAGLAYRYLKGGTAVTVAGQSGNPQAEEVAGLSDAGQ